ncbi:DNA mismatch endonuclease Vsr [Mesorhizobium sp. M0088]|uniref:very short patch repair endonuclease n=1 Tax=Mesorhizobium sp. M0088 TaxID=2956873 RepID=UPI003337D2C6
MSSVDPIRSRIMGAVRQRDTGPETVVRQVLHGLGLRFRLHRKDLAGTPDIVLPKHKTAIFVHGCFWHRHTGCSKATTPKTRVQFWQEKFDRNVDRDLRNESALRNQGWSVFVIWECETRDLVNLRERLWRGLILPSCMETKNTKQLVI